jgi:trigger factor
LDELTDDLRTRIGRMRRVEQAAQARDEVLDAILEATDVPLPESVLAAEVENQMHSGVHAFDHDEDRFTQFLEEQGTTREEFETDARAAAERNVKTRLVLDALADQEEVSVSEQELTERIIYQAQQYQMRPEEFAQRIQEAGQLGAVYSDIRRSKALVEAVKAATVTDSSGAAVDLSELLGGDADDAAEVPAALADDAPGAVTDTRAPSDAEGEAVDGSATSAQPEPVAEPVAEPLATAPEGEKSAASSA